MRRLLIVVLFVSLGLPATALAQDEPRGEAAVSFTWGHANLDDIFVYEPVGAMVEATGYVNEWFGITGEVGWATRSGEIFVEGFPVAVTFETIPFMGGVRFRFANDSSVTPSLRVVAGGTYGKSVINGEPGLPGFVSTETSVVFSMAAGGAIDIDLGESAAIRVQPDVVTFEFEDTMFRLAAGVVFRF